MKYLIINADDFGYSRERDEGIVKCFKDGNMSSTSLLVNGLAVTQAVKLSHQHSIPTGLHLNLTEGTPIGQTKYSTLVGEDGFFLGKMGFRRAVNDDVISEDEVRQEIQCQIDKFRQLMGITPVHVDGHQHIHIIPGICEIFASVLKDNNISVTRVPYEDLRDDTTWVSPEQAEFKFGVVQNAVTARTIFTQIGIKATDSFVGLQTMGANMTVDRLVQQLSHVFRIDKSETVHEKVMTCELMAHPGYITNEVGGCGQGPDGFSQSIDREHEMSVLGAKNLKTFYKNAGIQLSSFQQCIQYIF